MTDSKPFARATDELESRMTQIQEGEDDEDIPALDKTRAMGSKDNKAKLLETELTSLIPR